jgi:hypothetical protein
LHCSGTVLKTFQKSSISEEKREINMPISIGNQNTSTLETGSLSNALKKTNAPNVLAPSILPTDLKPQSAIKAQAPVPAPAADPNIIQAFLKIILMVFGAQTPQAKGGIQLGSDTQQ